MSKIKNRLVVYAKLMDLNKYTNQSRTNRYIAASTKSKTTSNVMKECLSQRLQCRIDRDAKFDLKLYWITPNDKKDPDNVMSEIKFLLDGIKESGLLSNDGRKNIRHISHCIRTIKNKEFVIIRFIQIKK